MKKVKVMVFGVFDLLHPGHLDFFKQAKELGDYLIVSVARDVNVVKLKNQKPIHNERKRMQNIRMVPYVDKIVLGGKTDPWPHILKEKPDVIALGYDQKAYISAQTDNRKQVAELETELQKRGLRNIKVMRLKPFWEQVYKSKLIRKKHEV